MADTIIVPNAVGQRFVQLVDRNGNIILTTQQAAVTSPPAGGTGLAAGAYDTAANRDLMIASINNILTALRAHGIIAT